MFNTYSFPEEPIPYRKVGFEYPLAMDSITKRVYRDKLFIDTMVTIVGSPHVKYKFKLNKKCVHSFMGNGSDSGPIYWQYKGNYDVRNDSIMINFTELRSIGYSAKHQANMKIEDRPWKNLDYLPSKTFIIGDKRDTIWTIQDSGFKGSYLINK